jgi:hypothetical protein
MSRSLKSVAEHSRVEYGTNAFVFAQINGYTGVQLSFLEVTNLKSRRLKAASALAVIFSMAGCGGSSVKLQNPSIPEPLIDKLPLKVAARYPEVFDHFVHEEQVIGKEKWSIDLGQANRMLFTQLFGSMFTEFSVIDADDDARDLGLDALIEPSIDAFEFSVPSQSQTEDFAVWIRYRIKIFDTDGVQVANWPIAAYGKSMTTTFGGDAALQRAAILAMRDAAALIILQMDKATGISKLSSAKKSNAETAPAVPTPESEPINLHTTAAEEPSDETR